MSTTETTITTAPPANGPADTLCVVQKGHVLRDNVNAYRAGQRVSIQAAAAYKLAGDGVVKILRPKPGGSIRHADGTLPRTFDPGIS